MAIQWHAVQRLARPGDSLSPKRWFVQAVVRSLVTTDTLADRIAKRTSLSTTDVKAVIHALVYEILQALLGSDAVELEGIMFIYPSAGGEGGSDTPEGLRKVKKSATVTVRLAGTFRDQLAAAKFEEEPE